MSKIVFFFCVELAAGFGVCTCRGSSLLFLCFCFVLFCFLLALVYFILFSCRVTSWRTREMEVKTKRKGGLVPERDVLDLVFFGVVVLVRLAHFSGGHLFGQGPFRART